MKHLAELYKDYAGSDVQFISVLSDVTSWGGNIAEAAGELIAATNAQFPHLGSTPELTVGVSYIPSAHFFDSKGNLIAKVVGEKSDREWINLIETLAAMQ